ncbi:MAG: hypothetical protein N2258_03130 [Brevinematales bacterium]|nr:hypothetical protein [Brevinematales bacterium]
MNRKIVFGFLLILFVVVLNLKIFSVYLHSRNYIDYRQSKISGVADIISTLDIKTKLASLLMVNFYEDINITVELIEKTKISSFIIMSYNVDSNYERFKKKLNFIKSHSNTLPITFSVDQEGGYVERLSPILGETEVLQKIFLAEGMEGVERIAHKFGKELRELGIDINFSPIIEVIKNPKSVVKDRVFSSNLLSNLIASQRFIDIISSYGVIAVAKHYPGYGTIEKDPHYEICIDKNSYLDELKEPFEKITNIKMIMSSHVIYSRIDNLPGTLSVKVMGYTTNFFDGILITDDLLMDSITLIYDYRLAALRALLAGNDIILLVDKEGDYKKWQQKIENLIDYLYQAYKNGELTEEQIDRSLKKIIYLKFGLY